MKLIHNLQLLLLYSIESSFHCCNAQMNDHIFSNIANPAEKNEYCCNYKHIPSSQGYFFVEGVMSTSSMAHVLSFPTIYLCLTTPFLPIETLFK